jgi:hypothetical protein
VATRFGVGSPGSDGGTQRARVMVNSGSSAICISSPSRRFFIEFFSQKKYFEILSPCRVVTYNPKFKKTEFFV